MTSIVVKRTKFTDIDLNFSKHPISKDITKRVDLNAVVTAVKNLVFTKRYDRLFHPEIYCQVYDMLFENITQTTQIEIKKTIENVLKDFEPRVKILDVNVQTFPDDNHVYIELMFQVVGTLETVNTKFALERTI